MLTSALLLLLFCGSQMSLPNPNTSNTGTFIPAEQFSEAAGVGPYWPELLGLCRAIGDDQLATEFLADHPQLAARYADPGVFISKAHTWRALVPPLPAGLQYVDPALLDLDAIASENRMTVVLTFKQPGSDLISRLTVAYVDQEMADVQVTRGFVNTFGIRHTHHRRHE